MYDFYELNKKTVNIGIGNNEYIEVNMLPIKYAPLLRDLKKQFITLNNEQDFNLKEQLAYEIKQKVAAICCEVMPEPMHETIMNRLPMIKVIALADVLLSGEDNSDEDTDKKKVIMMSAITTVK